MLDEALDEAVARPIESYSLQLQLRVNMLRIHAKIVMYIGVLTSVLFIWTGPLVLYFSFRAARLNELRPNSLRRELRRLQIVALIVFLNAFFLALTMILMFGTLEFSAASHAEHNRVAQKGSWIILTFSNSWLLPSLIGEFHQGNLRADDFPLLVVAVLGLSFAFNQFLLQWYVGGALTLLGGTNKTLWRCRNAGHQRILRYLTTPQQTLDHRRIFRASLIVSLILIVIVLVNFTSNAREILFVVPFYTVLMSLWSVLYVASVHQNECVNSYGSLIDDERAERHGVKARDDDAAGPENSERFLSSAADLVLGEPRDAVLGLCHVMRVNEAEVRSSIMLDGVNAVIREFSQSGTEEDLRYLQQVLETKENPPEMPDDMEIPGWKPMSYYYSHPNAKIAELDEGHVLALRMYTTPAFASLNKPLRASLSASSAAAAASSSGDASGGGAASDAIPPHPFPCTMVFISDGIKKLRAVEEAASAAKRGERATKLTTRRRAKIGSMRGSVQMSDNNMSTTFLNPAEPPVAEAPSSGFRSATEIYGSLIDIGEDAQQRADSFRREAQKRSTIVRFVLHVVERVYEALKKLAPELLEPEDDNPDALNAGAACGILRRMNSSSARAVLRSRQCRRRPILWSLSVQR